MLDSSLEASFSSNLRYMLYQEQVMQVAQRFGWF